MRVMVIISRVNETCIYGESQTNTSTLVTRTSSKQVHRDNVVVVLTCERILCIPDLFHFMR